MSEKISNKIKDASGRQDSGVNLASQHLPRGGSDMTPKRPAVFIKTFEGRSVPNAKRPKKEGLQSLKIEEICQTLNGRKICRSKLLHIFLASVRHDSQRCGL